MSTPKEIKRTPEYWAQPGAVAYSYVNKQTRAVCNVDRIDEAGVLCWAINAWGSTSQWYVDPDKFFELYEEIENPRSMYDAMDEAAGRS